MDISTKELARYIGKKGTWVFQHGENTIKLPVTVIDVKPAYGTLRLLVRYAKDEEPAWVLASNVKVQWLENESKPDSWGSQYREA